MPEEKIRQRAYELWLQHGAPEGRAVEFWLMAEEEFRTQEVSHPAVAPKTNAPRIRKAALPKADATHTSGASRPKSRAPRKSGPGKA